VNVDDISHSRNVHCLPTSDLRAVLPAIDEYFQLFPLDKTLKEGRKERITLVSPPDVLSNAPGRSDFWNVSSDGAVLSALGCFPLSRAISRSQYNAVLESQQHLKTLKMLHVLDDVEILRLVNRLQSLLDTTMHRDLLETLLQGLTFNEIQVYKGMDTGFGVPGDGAHLWGISAGSTSGAIDIFISQKAPTLAATVLHVYLAHHGISREQRYEEELRLEHSFDSVVKAKLPISIQSELADATNSELLFLLEQLKISKLIHPFSTAIREICVSRLVSESSREAWTEAHSKHYLEGSLSMRELLQMRLVEFARRGAQMLPSLDNLERLSRSVDCLVSDSLFSAQREKLELLSKTLSAVYRPWEGSSTIKHVDMKADLFTLMFFCALRRQAFETVFLETTDRCPFFLTQPDQAGVFSELWVLGSQCEIYFGIQPRALGKIIYDKYRDHLKDNPPPADSFNGVNVLTMYSFSHKAEIEPAPKEHWQHLSVTLRIKQKFAEMSEKAMELGALSIFCMPAIIDVCLLTWFGRGFFQTAFMDVGDRLMASYAVIAALLISAGTTGWVGSVGGHYLYNFAFDNMNFFLVQRLSSGFILSVLVSLCGLLAFTLEFNSPRFAAVFVAYVIALSSYLNLLG
jgi:hypothetical protein